MQTILAAGAPAPTPGGAAVLPLIFLALAMVVGVVLVSRVLRDVKRTDGESLTEPGDLLGPLEEAFASGQMSEEEYHRIRDSARRSGFADTRWALPVRPRGEPVGEKGPPPAPPEADPAGS